MDIKPEKNVTRLAPTKDTLNLLFSLCGNVCAFPGCDHEVFDNDDNFIAQICHIEGALEGGQRFNPQSDNESRRVYSNLIILCYRHHKVTDNTKVYTTYKMLEMKTTHEAQFRKQAELPPIHLIDKVYNEEILRSLESISADTQSILSVQEIQGQMINALYEKQISEVASAESNISSFDMKITEIMELKTRGQHQTAFALLESMRKNDFSKLSQNERYRLAANQGVLKLDLLENELAAGYFIEALNHQPENPKAINFGILGFVLKGEEANAEKWIKNALLLMPNAPGIYSSLVRLKSKLPIAELISLVPEHIRQNAEVAYEIARACQDQHQFQEAITWAQIALEQAGDTRYEFRAILATMILYSIQQPYQVVTGQVSQDTKVKAKYIVELYTQAWEEIKGTSLQKSRAWYLINRGVARKYYEDLEGAYEDFLAACSISEHDLAWKHLLIGAVETGRMEKTWEVIEVIKTNIPNTDQIELAILEADIRWQIGEHKQAVALLEAHMNSEMKPSAKKHVFDFLIERYIALGELTKANELNEQFKAFAKSPFAPAIFSGKIALQEGDNETAETAFDLAFDSLNSDSKEPEIRDLAKQYETLGHLDKAIELNEKITNLEIFSTESSRLLDLYFKAGEQKKLLQACERLITLYGPVSKLTELKSHIYESIHNLPAAIAACEEHLAIYPDDQFIRARLALIFARSSNQAGITSTIQGMHHLDRSLPREIQFQIAYLFKEIGDLDRFRAFSYETRRQFSNLKEGHEGYIHLHAIGARDVDRAADPERVEKDTVIIIRSGEHQATFSIEDREDLNRANGELLSNSDEASALLGKHVGDQVILNNGERIGEISEIYSKYNYALKESFRLISSTFAGTGTFRSYQIGDTGDFGTDFKPLVDMINRSQKREHHIDNFLADKQLPIAAVAQIKNTNLVKFWSQVTSADQKGIINTVNMEEVTNALGNLKRKVPILLDVTALCTIASMDAFAEIDLLDNPKYISQSTLMVFHEIIQELKPSAESGSLNIGKYNGRYIKNITSAEEVQRYIDRLTNVLTWAAQKCELLPCHAALSLNAHEKAKLDKAFGESTVDSLLTARDNQCLLYSEDAYLRIMAANDHQLSGMASFMIFVLLMVQQKISIERYTTLMTDLGAMHYIGVPTDTSILMEATRRSKYKPGWPLNHVLQGLVSPLMTPEYTFNVICKYFIRVYKDSINLIFDQDIQTLRGALIISVLQVLEMHYDIKHAENVLLQKLVELMEPNDPDFIIITNILKRFTRK